MAGLDPAIHAAPLKDASNIVPLSAKRLRGFFVLTAGLSPFRRAENVDGRVKPGHDALKSVSVLFACSELAATNGSRYLRLTR